MLDVTCQNSNMIDPNTGQGTGRPCTEKGVTKQADTDGSVPIICGVCGQEITDVKPAGS